MASQVTSTGMSKRRRSCCISSDLNGEVGSTLCDSAGAAHVKGIVVGNEVNGEPSDFHRDVQKAEKLLHLCLRASQANTITDQNNRPLGLVQFGQDRIGLFIKIRGR